MIHNNIYNNSKNINGNNLIDIIHWLIYNLIRIWGK